VRCGLLSFIPQDRQQSAINNFSSLAKRGLEIYLLAGANPILLDIVLFENCTLVNSVNFMEELKPGTKMVKNRDKGHDFI